MREEVDIRPASLICAIWDESCDLEDAGEISGFWRGRVYHLHPGHPFVNRYLVFSGKVVDVLYQACHYCSHTGRCLGASGIDDLLGEVWVKTVGSRTDTCGLFRALIGPFTREIVTRAIGIS